MRKEKKQTKLKAILSLSLVFAWFLCLPIIAKEKAPMNPSYSNEGHERESIIIETPLTPLEIRSKLTAELFQLVKIKNKSHMAGINFTPKKTNILPASYSNQNKHIKSQQLENSLFTTSLIACTILNAADYVTTIKALKYESLQEGNPLMKPLVKKPYLYATVKLGITALNLKLMKGLYKKDKRLAWVVSTIVNFALSYVVINNIRMIKKAQSM